MPAPIHRDRPTSFPEFVLGGGEMGQRIREHDWSKTSLGPLENWPQSLRTCIRIMLASRQPIWIGWGKELIKLYNDPYKAIVGGKHPWALGLPASVVWKDIWKEIEPMLNLVMEEDEGTYAESQLLIMERNGYPEETYYTFSYTPIPGDDGTTAGMICANTDDTDRIISERQLKTLTQLGKNLTDTQTRSEIIEKTISTIKDNAHDFPFALFYAYEEGHAVFAGATDLSTEALVKVMPVIHLEEDNEISNTLKQAVASRKIRVFEDLTKKIGEMPKGAWETAPDKAIIMPIAQTGYKDPFGFLIIALNPYRLLDEKYSGFFSLIADQMVTSFSNVHALEEERKRAAALAEIDRAKTTFFSNISHEFRTPLTLLLGPIEDALSDTTLSEDNRLRMDVAFRNALRMQKLVNTLLEFSRIEAGRTEGRFRKTDIVALTQDLASTFRSAIEKAGMHLQITSTTISNDVYVDTDMWENIVLNLLSNAFKYSYTGTITVDVRETDGQLQLTVTDSGVGIPHDQLDKIFDRFHRVESIEGRSQEGTGIGLAMVKELVKLHAGTITVKSEPGKGSAFTVRVPTGKEHLEPAKIFEEHKGNVLSSASQAYTQEAFQWLNAQDKNTDQNTTAESGEHARTVLLADDNADMREYVQRLLSKKFTVITAVDGEDALNKISLHKPDLLLTDVMMPKMDGFKLMEKLRSDPDTKNIPVIFLSARAGEEAKVEGINSGADDYLVKPFSAKELMARVDANIKINISRRQATELLEKEVEKRTRQLNELNTILQQSNSDLQQFAHVASHDLKEPLRKIKMFTGRLADDPSNAFSERSKIYLSKVDSATERLFTMVDGVLHYSTINSTEQQNEMIDLNVLLKDAESDLEVPFTLKSAAMHYSQLPVIEGAKVLVYQLFYNLISNSLKFSSENRPPVISISSSLFKQGKKDFAEIRITDNGIGFKPEQADKIFNTFARLNSKDKYEGTGLGLALCRRIVHRHGGTITAEGKPGDGAVFTIQLPLKQDETVQ